MNLFEIWRGNHGKKAHETINLLKMVLEPFFVVTHGCGRELDPTPTNSYIAGNHPLRVSLVTKTIYHQHSDQKWGGMPEHWSNILQFDEINEDHLLFSLFFQRAWWNPLTQVIHVPNNCIQLCIFVPFGSKRQLSGKGIVPTSTTFSDGLYSRIPGRTLGGLWQVGGRVERGKGFAPGPCRREDEEGRLCLSRLSRALVTQLGFWLRRTCRVKVRCLGIGCAAGMVLVGGELCGIEYESQNCFLGGHAASDCI